MVERQITGPVRKRRSSATLQRLEAARSRRAEQLERERENERRVDAALGPFAEAVTAIEAVERRREDRVAALQAQLERRLAELDRQRAAKIEEFERLAEQVRTDAEMEIGEWRAVMARSVAQIRAADVGASETAALLGISPKTVTVLSRLAVEARGHTSDGPASVSGADADSTAGLAERLAESSQHEPTHVPYPDGEGDVPAD
ncbi:hypothetical protein [Amycolatopsis plumensis]|uniref:Uncharacterized protein n=1 Tax=Amycolatopsis plumensis TaxID=236508 RepID=A0ABV5U439_9PSEU